MRNPSPEAVIAKSYLDNKYLCTYHPFEQPEYPLSESHLVWMLEQITMEYMPRTKANRWLGYVQGVMVAKGFINVQDERNRTRPVFKGD
ncbi:hypothetical protein DIREPILLOW8_61 [Vibrio phage Direpillow8]|uniref:Uncharacterized protein n=8 Tax=Thalassavirus TaxID=2948922 RepID=A0A6M4EUF9_9CAUD|nr:hypothetical protein FDJ20_gp059 [Vibrio phage Thalassa]YP_010101833.1 hypothetical protein KNU52_gp054 [Vibrio phage Achelous]YP_010102489.1 hypothetical protein KNU58_gp049 [Vibrio phage Brizo]YP_010102677.1 hypothetical protein KNU59_gp056 [Vibrio phage Pontus]YP_010105650.1 hypothetical protein KNU87_gp057 [Vibrio phage Bennett]YP_010105844.1 hypothetical protein KNU88_gp058 [Vibrio phage Chester]YP_010107908.1 hypothetical protein KNV05_gp060 [Vibrio phage River4]YP_010108488.1 hypot